MVIGIIALAACDDEERCFAEFELNGERAVLPVCGADGIHREKRVGSSKVSYQADFFDEMGPDFLSDYQLAFDFGKELKAGEVTEADDIEIAFCTPCSGCWAGFSCGYSKQASIVLDKVTKVGGMVTGSFSATLDNGFKFANGRLRIKRTE